LGGVVKLAGHGFEVELLDGWEARLFRRRLSVGPEQQLAVLHLANFPLPETRGDFGAGVVEFMRDDDVFVVLFDYGAEACAQPLFARRGMPALRSTDFHRSNLQRTIAGQVGCQHFFQHGGRALGLYVVTGVGRTRANHLAAINATISKIGVSNISVAAS
jgi:hypothetical protein